jgi:outer membrane murein-binding lipoprotein Lpp
MSSALVKQGEGMTMVRWSGLGVLVLLAGCSHSISGVYVARGQQFSELLQITQSPDGQLLGTLNHTAVKSDGSLERFTLNISGTTDGHAVTLVGKANEPFAIPTNMSGTVDAGGISLMQPIGIERFTNASVPAYQSDVQALAAQSVAIHQRNADRQRQQQLAAQETAREEAQQQYVANEDQYAGKLADNLNRYVAMIQAHHDLNPFDETHAKILGAARHDLEIERGYPHGSVQAAQVDVRINQLGVQLTQFDIPYNQGLDRGQRHLQEFDAAIAKSPCHTSQDALSNCSLERDSEAAYHDAKVILQRELDDIATTVKRDTDAMNGIIKEADSIE